MSELKELKRLKDEEKGLMNIAIKLNDQLNRLKVEELALLSMLHKEALPDKEHEKGPDEEEQLEDPDLTDQPSSSHSKEVKEKLVPLDLNVRNRQEEEDMEEEEEEEEDDEENFVLNALLF
ncbi:uncharacterized protein LOC111101726 [Crassostrea virginica]